MASGKKNYFRHSFVAHSDPKLQELIEDVGFDAYGKWWILLELLGAQCEESSKELFEIHVSSLASCWKSHKKSCINLLEKFQLFDLISVTFNNNIACLNVPNFPKYLGRYTNKIDPNTSNKRKEKERKEKERKEKESKELAPKPEKKISVVGCIAQFQGDPEIENLLKEIGEDSQRRWLKTYEDLKWLTAEFLKMIEYAEINPQKRPKTARGLTRFISGWLSRGWEWHRKGLPSNGLKTQTRGQASVANSKYLLQNNPFKNKEI